MNIGLHISTLGAPLSAIRTAEQAGMQAVQIFPGNPRGFFASPNLPDRYEGNSDIVIHSHYVINLGMPVPKKTIPGAISQIKWAQAVGAKYIVFHAGSSKEKAHNQGVVNFQSSLHQLVEYLDGSMTILVENMSQGRPYGTKGSLGG